VARGVRVVAGHTAKCSAARWKGRQARNSRRRQPVRNQHSVPSRIQDEVLQQNAVAARRQVGMLATAM